MPIFIPFRIAEFPASTLGSVSLDITHEFVAGISFSTTEERLVEAFSKFGQVIEGNFCSYHDKNHFSNGN